MDNSKKKILIVEDETIIAMYTREILLRRGDYTLQVVTTGEEAVSIVSDDPPDLILMDITLDGELDGIEATRKIKDMKDIPIIFLTANSDENTLDMAQNSGADALIRKPFKPDRLYNLIDNSIK